MLNKVNTESCQTKPASDALKTAARQVFDDVRSQVISILHLLEDSATPPLHTGKPGRIRNSSWLRGNPDLDLGGGTTGLLNGKLFEKACAHVSEVYGPIPDSLANALPGNAPGFWASGVSVIIHPRSPLIPSAHMNIRMISTDHTWFGGGADLTPMVSRQRIPDYPDTRKFHNAMKLACDSHQHASYQTWTRNCDEYFYLPHRKQPRGTGGIFFDHFTSNNYMNDLKLLRAVGDHFARAYQEIVQIRMRQGWNSNDRSEQLHWRGQYAEFNLIHDRGTRFGLLSGGNVASILSSLPPTATWS